MVFQWPHQRRLLQQALPHNEPLSVAQVEAFQLYDNALESVYHDQEQRQHVAMTALMAACFAKPILPRNWFFVPSTSQLMLDQGLVVELDTVAGDTGTFMVIQSAQGVNLLLNLTAEALTLNDEQQLEPMALLRVMDGYIARYATSLQNTTTERRA